MFSFSRTLIKFGAAALSIAIVLAAVFSLSGCASSSGSALAASGSPVLKKLSLTPTARSAGLWGKAIPSGGAQMILTQTTVQPAAPDATSGATSEEASGTESAAPEAVSSASTEESAVKDAAYCLKCHGSFEKLLERTKDYVTEWDEKANPHQYVPHNSTKVAECSECHDPHPIPFKKVEDARKPNVDYCYSCHHAQTLVNCKECHNE
jgi:predicted CXXCH cytochrome family protein